MKLPEKAAVKVQAYEAGDGPAWDHFVTAAPEGTFFHLSGWKQVIEESFGHNCPYLVAKRGDAVTGVLPLTHLHSRLFGNSLVSNAFCVCGGPLASDQASLDALLDAAEAIGQDRGVENLELRLLKRVREDWPCDSETYCTFRKAIDPDPDANLAKIRRKQRAMVRKAIKLDLVSELDQDPKRLFAIYAESVRNLGTPVFSRRYFSNLSKVFGEQTQILTICHEHKPVASVLSFYFRDEVLPYYGGATNDARTLAANDFMYWEVMRRACLDGYKIFDFGRSKQGTGPFNFKRHWGFEPQPLYYEHKLFSGSEIPQRNPLNPKYALAIATWKRLPLPIANRLGPLLARGLG